MPLFFGGFGQFETFKTVFNHRTNYMRHFEVITKMLATGIPNSELVLYPLKVHSASHTIEILKYFKFCDPAKQELTGHWRLLV